MIDIMPKVFTTIRDALPSSIDVTNVGQMVSESFPCVTIQEISNVTYIRSQDESLIEHHARLGYSINVYSTVSDTEARAIAMTVDSLMQGMKFTRTQFKPTPNLDHTIHRYTAVYEAIVAEGVTDGNTTTYQMYRR